MPPTETVRGTGLGPVVVPPSPILSGIGILCMVVAAVFILISVPAPVFSEQAGIGWENSLVSRKGKPKTIKELVKLYDSTHCVDCHVKSGNEWEASAHSEPIIGKRRPGRKAMAILTIFDVAKAEWPFTKLDNVSDVKVEHLAACTRCHLPQLEDAEDSVAQELVGDFIKWRDAKKAKDEKTTRAVENKLSGLTVNCLICHNRNAVIHKWKDGFPDNRTVYGSRNMKHPVGKYPYVKVTPTNEDPIMCGQCHGLGALMGRDNPSQCPTAYGSYLFDYKARGGEETCQDCHIRKEGKGHNVQSYRDPLMIEEAMEFDALAEARYVIEGGQAALGVRGKYGRKLHVAVKMKNLTGHPIPDGCPTVTRLVLTTVIRSADGEEVFFDEKIYQAIPQSYGRGDKMGRGPFQKTGLIIDTALPPLQTVLAEYEIPIPDSAGDGKKSEYKVDVKLVYQPFGTDRPEDDPIKWRDFTGKVVFDDAD